jgi:PAS domain S-box-containing protein
MVSKPSPGFVAASSPWQPWGVLAVGLVFTAFAGSVLLGNLNWTTRVELLVHQLTGEMGERQRAEEALRQSEAQFRYLFQSNPRPMWVYALGTLRFLEVNEAATAHYGYSREEFLQMDLTQLSPTDDVEPLTEDGQFNRPTIQPAEGSRHQFKNGQVIDVRITSHVLDHLGQPAVLVMAEDITERQRADKALRQARQELEVRVETRTAELTKLNRELQIEIGERQRAEGALRQSEAFYASLVDVLPHRLCRKDLTGHFTFGNRSFCEAMHVSLADLVGKTDFHFHPANLAERFRQDDQQGPALDIPYCHHERWDGTGYPRGLLREAIPLAARAFAVVDVWDALTSNRQYRKACSMERAREHIEMGSGSHFDPQMVQAFLPLVATDENASFA